MTDITERLRRLYTDSGTNYVGEAADLIDRLRARLEALEDIKPVQVLPFYPLSGDLLAWVNTGERLLKADGWGPLFHFGVWWGERPWRVWEEMERLKGTT